MELSNTVMIVLITNTFEDTERAVWFVIVK